MDDWGDPHFRANTASELCEERRRELTAAHTRWANSDGAKQMLMAYRHSKNASVAPGFEFKPGFIYAAVRAISARINQNWDGWPSGELKRSYRTFLGKPCFVNHQNFDPKKARGKVVAARYVEAGDDKYVETVMEIDAQRFPKLAKEIKEGGMDSVSMGVEAGFTICSYCGNKAVDVPEFCEHVKYHKGQKLGRINQKTGAVEPVLVYEKCYKLGFFELSFVFDPADETSVVSRVIAANNRYAQAAGEPMGSNMTPVEMPTEMPSMVEMPSEMPSSPMMPTAGRHEGPPDHPIRDFFSPHESPEWQPLREDFAPKHLKQKPSRRQDPLAIFEARITRLAYGEIEAPAQVDTLRDEDDDGSGFKRYVKSPKELQPPDLDQAKRLDRDQESEGLDTDRRAEDVENVSGPPQGAPQGGISMSARRRYRYAQDDPMAALMGGGGAPPPPDDGSGGPPPDDGSGGGAQSDEELIAQAEQDLQMYEQGQGGGDEGAPPEEDEGLPPEEGDEGLPPEEGDEEGMSEDQALDEGGPPPEEEDEGDGSDLPPWLQGGGGEEDAGPPPPPELTARRNGNRRSSTQKKRRTVKGAPQMSLAQRTRVAATQRPRHHYADTSGNFDGGPYGEDNQGEQEEVFLSDTPSAESVAAPTPGDGTISNTENNLVARINRRANEMRRDLIAYEQITGRRIQGGPYDVDPSPGAATGGGPAGPSYPAPPGETEYGGYQNPHPGGGRAGSRYGGPFDVDPSTPGGAATTGAPNYPAPAGETEYGGYQNPHPGGGTTASRRYAEAVESPDEVNPTVQTGPAGEELTGDDFESLGESPTETQPKDASVRAFRAFDNWLHQATGRTARQHANSNFIRRSAARFCSANGWDPSVMFPALGTVLREARRNEGRSMRRYADEKLEVAAPQDRIDVEAPVSDTTDALAQASQPDLGDFGSNASDNLADPDLSVDSQIWAPGEGTSKSSNRKTDGITAVRYAEAYIQAGLAPNTSEEKWKIAGLAQTMRLGTIRDRIGVLDAVNAVQASRQASTRRTAGINRGGGNSVPPGFSQRQLTAGTAHFAGNDISTDSAMFIK